MPVDMNKIMTEVIRQQRQVDPDFMKFKKEAKFQVKYGDKVKDYKNFESAFKFGVKVNAETLTNTSKFDKKGECWGGYYQGKGKDDLKIYFNPNEPVDFKTIIAAEKMHHENYDKEEKENNMQEKIEKVVAAGEATAVEKTDSPYLKKDTPNYTIKLFNDKFVDKHCSTKHYKHLTAAIRMLKDLNGTVEFTNNRDIFITKTKKGTIVRGTHWYKDSEMWFAKGTYTIDCEQIKSSQEWLDANMNGDQDRMLSYIKPHMTLKGE